MEKGEENQNPEENKENTGLSPDVLKLIKEQGEKIAKLEQSLSDQAAKGGGVNHMDVATISAAILESRKLLGKEDVDYGAGIAVEQIPVDDWDEKGVRFCAPLVGYLINDDRRKGHRVLPPFGVREIFFEYVATKRTRAGKYEQVAPICAFESHSKAQIKWLREHSLYGIMFFETSTQAANVDASRAMRMSTYLQVVKNYELNDLMKRCKEYNLPMSEDAQVMRTNIAYKMAELEIENEKKISLQALEDSHKESLLLGNKKQATA